MDPGMVPSDEDIKEKPEEKETEGESESESEPVGDIAGKAESDSKESSEKAPGKKKESTESASLDATKPDFGEIGMAGGALAGQELGGADGAAIGAMLGGAAGSLVSDNRIKAFATEMGILDEEADLEDLREYLGFLEETDPAELQMADRMLLHRWRAAGSPEDNFDKGVVELDPEEFDIEKYSPEDVAALDALVDQYDTEGDSAIAHIVDPEDRAWFDKWREYKGTRAASGVADPETDEPELDDFGMPIGYGGTSETAAAAPAQSASSGSANMDDIDENEIIATALARRF
jgi:hypothetical protein